MIHTIGNFFGFFKNRELNELYVSISIRAFAISLIGVFVPVYFYLIGYPLISIFFFYMLHSLAHIAFSVPVAKISSRFGIKHSILFSIPSLIIFFFLLYSIEIFSWPLALLAIFSGLSTSMFWIPYHIEFAKFSDRKNRGKEIGFSAVIASLFSILGPVLGGIFLTIFGFKILFMVVSALLFLSVIPLFFSKEVHEPVPLSLSRFFKGQKITDILSFLGHGIENKLGTIVWPLFIFIFILGEKYTSLGIVASLAVGMAFLSTIFVSRFSDLYRKTVLKIGSVFNAVIWVAKSFIVTPLQVFVAGAFYGISQTAMHISFDAINYDRARKNNLVKIILEREIYHHIGVLILFLILIFFTESLTEIFRYAGSLSSLMRFFF